MTKSRSLSRGIRSFQSQSDVKRRVQILAGMEVRAAATGMRARTLGKSKNPIAITTLSRQTHTKQKSVVATSPQLLPQLAG
jgi:hypothetical protein